MPLVKTMQKTSIPVKAKRMKLETEYITLTAGK
jgi:hypothetical protein